MPHMRTDHIMHPHNISIQLWLETGILGVVLFLVFTVFLYRSVVARAEKEQKYMFVLVMPVLANLSMSYSMWQAWQLGMICTLAALITTAASAKENNQT
jgi:O-antigen ligase